MKLFIILLFSSLLISCQGNNISLDGPTEPAADATVAPSPTPAAVMSGNSPASGS